MTAKTPFSIFISHIHEEAPVAKALKEWLQACFPGHVSAFVSSDYEDIPLGKKWLAEIKSVMDRSRLLITLISPASFERMWIHLEAGWALGSEIDVLPICHTGPRLANCRPHTATSTASTSTLTDSVNVLYLLLRAGLGCPTPCRRK